MKFFALLIFCGSVRFIAAIVQNPTPYFQFKDEAINENDSNSLEKKSISNQCPYQLNFQENYGEPSRLSLPTLQSLPKEDDSEPQRVQDQDINSIMAELPHNFELPYQRKPPRVPLSWRNWTPYSSYDDYNQDATRSETYQEPYQLSPYMNENVFPPVRSLPPVSTQIRETIAEIVNNYQMDGLDIGNSLYLTPNVREVRSREEELFLDQLKHDATIPNILPTMPIPFVRTADSSSIHPGQDVPMVMVLFPGSVSDCALPFLLGCSPQIAHGSLVQASHSVYPAALGIEYRNEPEEVTKYEVISETS